MVNHDVVKEFLLEKSRWGLNNYEAILITNKETWEYLRDYLKVNVAGWELNGRYKHLVSSYTLGSIRFLDVENVTFKDIQMFTCASQNSTIILDLDYEAGYRGGSEGIMYLISRMRSKANCHSRLVIV